MVIGGIITRRSEGRAAAADRGIQAAARRAFGP